MPPKFRVRKTTPSPPATKGGAYANRHCRSCTPPVVRTGLRMRIQSLYLASKVFCGDENSNAAGEGGHCF